MLLPISSRPCWATSRRPRGPWRRGSSPSDISCGGARRNISSSTNGAKLTNRPHELAIRYDLNGYSAPFMKYGDLGANRMLCHPEALLLREGSRDVFPTELGCVTLRPMLLDHCRGATQQQLSPTYRGRSFAQKKRFRMTVFAKLSSPVIGAPEISSTHS